MVAKIGVGASLFGALTYNHQKLNDGEAKILDSNRIISTVDGGYTLGKISQSFEQYLLANRRTEKPIMHISLNPDPSDSVNDDQFGEIAEEYMREMGYGDQPYIVYKHEDIDRHHIHIVTVRVDESGRKLDSNFENRRSTNICRELERKHGLVNADEKGEKRVPDYISKTIDYKNGNLKQQIGNMVIPIIKEWHFQSIKELNSLLLNYNISVEEIKGDNKGNRYRGLKYHALDDKGDIVGHSFKSSLWDKKIGLEAVDNRINRSSKIIKDRKMNGRIRNEVRSAMENSRSRADLEKRLSNKDIKVLFRFAKDGTIYGVTFIDQQQKFVVNGSRIGKGFSAKVFNEKFNSTSSKKSKSDDNSIDTENNGNSSRKTTSDDWSGSSRKENSSQDSDNNRSTDSDSNDTRSSDPDSNDNNENSHNRISNDNDSDKSIFEDLSGILSLGIDNGVDPEEDAPIHKKRRKKRKRGRSM